MKTSFYLLSFISVLIIASCKKLDKKNPIEFTIKAHIPYNKEPIAGVKYVIREYKPNKKDYLGSVEYTDFTLEGETDASGNATISFFPKKNLKYGYDMSFDYGSISFQNYSGSYSLINPPHDVNIVRNDQMDFEIKALPLMDINYKLQNVNCQNSNDSMRIIIRNFDEAYYLDMNMESWSPYNYGCYLDSENYTNAKAGRYVYKMQVHRNGNMQEFMDTILLEPGKNHNLFIEY